MKCPETKPQASDNMIWENKLDDDLQYAVLDICHARGQLLLDGLNHCSNSNCTTQTKQPQKPKASGCPRQARHTSGAGIKGQNGPIKTHQGQIKKKPTCPIVLGSFCEVKNQYSSIIIACDERDWNCQIPIQMCHPEHHCQEHRFTDVKNAKWNNHKIISQHHHAKSVPPSPQATARMLNHLKTSTKTGDSRFWNMLSIWSTRYKTHPPSAHI